METIIHIGQHKTATTSLQKFLRQNKNELVEKGVFITDRILNYNHPSHYVLNIFALAKNRYSVMKQKVLSTKGDAYLDELDKTLPSEIEKIYAAAKHKNCNRILWTNEGLYLLNSKEEYEKLINLFRPYSSKITVICCFRDLASYKTSYIKKLERRAIEPSLNKDSFSYILDDSWLFDYDRKKKILAEVFDECLYFDYQKEDNIKPFMQLLNIEIEGSTDFRLNITK